MQRSSIWKRLVAATICVGVCCNVSGEPVSDAPGRNEKDGIDNRSFKSKLEVLAKARSSEARILLGIAEVYYVGERPFENGILPARDYYQRVLNIDADNRAANIMLLRFRVMDHLNELGLAKGFLNLASTIRSGKGDFPTNSHYYDSMHESASNRHEIAEGLEKSVQTNVSHIAEEGISLSNALSKAEAGDPENAIYAYLQAANLIGENSIGAAIGALKKAVSKQMVEDYSATRLRCRELVLEQIDVPWPDRGELMMNGKSYLVDFLKMYVSRPLLAVAEEMEKSDRLGAEELYKLIVMFGERCLPTKHSAQDLSRALTIQKMALEHLGRLYAAVGDKKSQMAVEDRAKAMGERVNRVIALQIGPRPTYGSVASQQQEYKDFVAKFVENGEWRALEEYAASPR